MSVGTSNHKDLLSPQYFNRISQALSDAGVHQPTLVVDKARLDQNLSAVKTITERGFDFRIVAKSLPSVSMLKYLMAEAGTNRLMSFHMPFLQHVIEHIPDADILMGKPMPVGSVETFYQTTQSKPTTQDTFNPEKQLQWLIDSYDRIAQYGALAEKLDINMRISLEIDVGLHRGGFNQVNEFEATLIFIQNHKHLQLSGLMGYEAHITKVPGFIGGPKKAFDQAWNIYQVFVDSIASVFGEDSLAKLVFNSGGSTTYPLYEKIGLINEIATASALVKPTDFDVFTLDHHVPAAFIAAPVLKVIKDPELPMAKSLSKLMHRVGLLPRKACFIYGGNWLAQPCYPADSKRANILGHSSNQEMYELKASDQINVDDFMYFRPTQSEAVFLQFGEVAVYDDGKIVDWWPVFESKRSE
jgi:D-serine deaminase-like pyridoxal phosphate-dependent protein